MDNVPPFFGPFSDVWSSVARNAQVRNSDHDLEDLQKLTWSNGYEIVDSADGVEAGQSMPISDHQSFRSTDSDDDIEVPDDPTDGNFVVRIRKPKLEAEDATTTGNETEASSSIEASLSPSVASLASTIQRDSREGMRPIGASGHAVIWKAKPKKHSKYVAMKVSKWRDTSYARKEDGGNESFADLLRSSLDNFDDTLGWHQDAAKDAGDNNIARLYEVLGRGAASSAPWRAAAMELYHGSLFNLIYGRNEDGEYYFHHKEFTFLMFSQIVAALSWCHKRNIAHRDVTPSKILWKAVGSRFQFKLNDFSFAVEEDLAETALSGPRFPRGLLDRYTAPEVLEGNTMCIGDVYSLMAAVAEARDSSNARFALDSILLTPTTMMQKARSMKLFYERVHLIDTELHDWRDLFGMPLLASQLNDWDNMTEDQQMTVRPDARELVERVSKYLDFGIPKPKNLLN